MIRFAFELRRALQVQLTPFVRFIVDDEQGKSGGGSGMVGDSFPFFSIRRTPTGIHFISAYLYIAT